MFELQSYLIDRWVTGTSDLRTLVNPSTEEPVATTSTAGLDLAAALHHARTVGGPALRALTYAERAQMLNAMSTALHAHREELLELSRLNNGTTRSDGKFDVDGATFTLSHYARLGAELGAHSFLLDGEADKLTRSARFVGQHVRVPRHGVAVHINAFNFPAWGTFEKIAVALLAGMPVLSKPATATALLAWRMVQIVVEAGILPAGALQFLAGPAGDLLDHLGPQDVVAFTGSAETAARVRSSKGAVRASTHVNIEADSLNAAVLGPDVTVGSPVWHRFIRNIIVDMTQKTGQKCTAVRRVFVPEARMDDVCHALADELSRIVVGNPVDPDVHMGPVATAAQLRDVRAGIAALAEQTTLVCGGADPVDGRGAPPGKGYFVAPTLLRAPALAHGGARAASRVHEQEVFGPCATVLPYDGDPHEAAALLALGQGCLVSTFYSDDDAWLAKATAAAAPWLGRMQVISKKVADQATPPGTVLPSQLHGGPGRAGGGAELGGVRGLDTYMQRVAVQGDQGLLRRILE